MAKEKGTPPELTSIESIGVSIRRIIAEIQKLWKAVRSNETATAEAASVAAEVNSKVDSLTTQVGDAAIASAKAVEAEAKSRYDADQALQTEIVANSDRLNELARGGNGWKLKRVTDATIEAVGQKMQVTDLLFTSQKPTPSSNYSITNYSEKGQDFVVFINDKDYLVRPGDTLEFATDAENNFVEATVVPDVELARIKVLAEYSEATYQKASDVATAVATGVTTAATYTDKVAEESARQTNAYFAALAEVIAAEVAVLG